MLTSQEDGMWQDRSNDACLVFNSDNMMICFGKCISLRYTSLNDETKPVASFGPQSYWASCSLEQDLTSKFKELAKGRFMTSWSTWLRKSEATRTDTLARRPPLQRSPERICSISSDLMAFSSLFDEQGLLRLRRHREKVHIAMFLVITHD